MSGVRRRALLYAVAVTAAAGLLFAGYGITVPPDPGTQLNGAAFLAGLGQHDQALAACDEVLRAHPDFSDARVFRATFLAMAGRDGEAIVAYEDAIAHVRDNEVRCDLVLDRASVLLRAGRAEEFGRERKRLEAMGAGHRLDVWDGLKAEGEGSWEGATAAYGRAFGKKPDDEQLKGRLYHALLEQGRESLSAGRFDGARAQFDRAVELLPRAREARLRAAEVRLATGEVDEAIVHLRAAGRRAKGVAPLAFRAATLLLEGGRREPALDTLAAALVADREAVKALLQNETAWAPELSHEDVRALLETEQASTPGALTADGGVIHDPRNIGDEGSVR
jgi:tetratricopeptide (TPR) repeat protein